MGWASMYHVKKKLLFMLIILACHYNKHTYLLTYNLAPTQERKQSNTKLNHYAMGTCNRL